MILTILMACSLLSLVGVSIAAQVMLSLIRRENARQVAATRRLAGQLGAVARKLAEDNAQRTGTNLADDLEKIMTYTGVRHGE